MFQNEKNCCVNNFVTYCVPPYAVLGLLFFSAQMRKNAKTGPKPLKKCAKKSAPLKKCQKKSAHNESIAEALCRWVKTRRSARCSVQTLARQLGTPVSTIRNRVSRRGASVRLAKKATLRKNVANESKKTHVATKITHRLYVRCARRRYRTVCRLTAHVRRKRTQAKEQAKISNRVHPSEHDVYATNSSVSQSQRLIAFSCRW